ncbi:2-dehydropantoate 2-reductase N-terminal domain-containing protein [Mycobacterium intracellulare]|uniref:2-dehydropantoate 2-reductase N-terminal domain-containing protein n=1 Tax=Mycobacterium intracellulare TaxID=1767 RepID=UPI002F261367
MATNIALVGPGAVGTTVAALLSRAGHSVVVCGRTPRERIELRPDGADPIVVPGPVHTDPGEVSGPVDVVLLAVKATQNREAAGWLARLCDVHTIVVVLQNGVEQVEQVQPHCPRSPVIPGIVWYSAETQPHGWVRLRGEAALVLPSGPSAETVAELLRGAGCRVDCDPDIITAAWRGCSPTRWPVSWRCRGGGRGCFAATTWPRCRAATSPNAWPSRGPRVPGFPTASPTS